MLAIYWELCQFVLLFVKVNNLTVTSSCRWRPQMSVKTGIASHYLLISKYDGSVSSGSVWKTEDQIDSRSHLTVKRGYVVYPATVLQNTTSM